MRKLSVVLFALILLMTSCSGGRDPKVFYGVSDRYGFMIAVPERTQAVLVAVIPIDIIARYRNDLATQGTVSDDLGAIRSLFGSEASHYLKGNASQWDALATLLMKRENLEFRGIRPNAQALANLVLKHAGYLSKSAPDDTLGSLAGPYTTREDMIKVLRILGKKNPVMYFYDLGSFLPANIDAHHLSGWVQEWTYQALREAAR